MIQKKNGIPIKNGPGHPTHYCLFILFGNGAIGIPLETWPGHLRSKKGPWVPGSPLGPWVTLGPLRMGKDPMEQAEQQPRTRTNWNLDENGNLVDEDADVGVGWCGRFNGYV